MLRSHPPFLAALLLICACADDSPEHAVAVNPVFVPPAEGGLLPTEAGTPNLTPGIGDAGVAFSDATIAQPGATGGGATMPPRADAGGFVGNATPDAGPNTGSPEGGVTIAPGNPCTNGMEPLAANVRLRELSMYQTVKIPLYKDNAWVTTRNATLVQGKKSFVRVFVEPQSGFTARPLRALLTLDNNGTKTVLSGERMISRASTDEALDSTIDIPVAGDAIGASTQISAAIIETACTPASGASSMARIPSNGTQALNAAAVGDLHVVLVPVTLAGSTPDTSAAQLAKVKDALRAYYPVADVEVTAHAPISWSGALRADGSGWSQLLNEIGRQRTADRVAGNVYYFGLITPAAGFREYCRTGCVLGLAPQTTFVSRANQIGLGVGFVDENTYSTVVHELGHAHGLPHAPCVPRGGSIQGADTKFPYTGGKIGSWGWDSRTSKLMSPATYVDVMSYCEPTWISDYNYEKIATRCKAVNTAARIFFSEELAPVQWNGILLSASGEAQWSGISSDETPGETSPAKALDASGRVVAEIEVVRVALSHVDDSYLYVPALDASWVCLDLGDRKLGIASIKAAER
jgi:hypothetical protein